MKGKLVIYLALTRKFLKDSGHSSYKKEKHEVPSRHMDVDVAVTPGFCTGLATCSFINMSSVFSDICISNLFLLKSHSHTTIIYQNIKNIILKRNNINIKKTQSN